MQNRTSADSFLIFPINPDESGQIPTPPPPGASGWVDGSDTTSGPNVVAYLDQDNNDTLDPGQGEQPPTSGSHDFSHYVNLAEDPTAFDAATSPPFDNRYAAVVNLFYQNNVLHDVLSLHGFDSGFDSNAGNFEGSDPVLAEAQDGEGMNNANFATPATGSPRMQMFLWDLTPSTTYEQRRDGSLDFDIIAHEYGHGVTWRMIGDMSGPFGGASGEGFSDVLATWLTNEDRVAEYSSGWANGIRSTGYGSHLGTYGNFTGASVHNDGEIYAATMWDVRTAWMAQGWGEDELFKVVIGGLGQSSTLPQPAFEDMRNGLLDAIATHPSWTTQQIQDRQCLVWGRYAARGIGEGAQGELLPRGPRRFAIRITESNAVPAACSGGNVAPTAVITGPSTGTVGASLSFDGSLSSDPDLDSLTYSWDFGDNTGGSGVSVTHTYLAEGPFTVILTVDDSNGGVDSAQALVTVGPALPNQSPTAVITGPSTGTVGASLSFDGSLSSDPDLDSLTYSWDFGDGGSATGEFTSHAFSAGLFTVWLTVTDDPADSSAPLSHAVSMDVDVTASTGGLTLTDAVGSKVKGVKETLLTWTGGPPSSVFVFRDGGNVTGPSGTGNDGEYTDDIGKGGGSSFTYEVCENAGGTTCSNSVTVVF